VVNVRKQSGRAVASKSYLSTRMERLVSDRAVRQTGKDIYGNITSLADSGQIWSPRPSSDAIRDIESAAHSYYVPWQTGRTEIRVVQGTSGKYLRTDRDNTATNNLDELPNP